MTDETRLQVRPKDGDSSLSLSKVRPGLIARGRRDAALLTVPPSRRPADPLSETRRLAEEGDAKAQCALGHVYAAAIGVQQDDAEALKWFRLAAAQALRAPLRRPEGSTCVHALRRLLLCPDSVGWLASGRPLVNLSSLPRPTSALVANPSADPRYEWAI